MLVEEALKAQAFPFKMTHFRDGVEALNALTGESVSPGVPDVLVLDLNMPRMGGLELLAILKRHQLFRNVPVAILTSSLQPEEKEQARRLGAHRFVRKPVDLYEFLDRVGHTLRDLIENGRRGELTWID